jgi:hypothetical protein
VGPTCQPGAERAKAVRLEASSRVGGGNPAGRHRRAVGWAERVRWAGREAEAQWGGGKGRWKRKEDGPRLGRKRRKNSFPNKI